MGGLGWAGSTSAIQLQGPLAYLASQAAGLEILDVSDPAAPRWVGNYYTGGTITDLQWLGTNLLVNDLNLGLMILDVGNPTRPQLIGQTTNLSPGRSLQLVGTHAYVASGWGLHIVDLSQPPHPALIGFWMPADYGIVTTVHVTGQIAYVGIDRDPGIEQDLIDVSDPSHPTLLRSISPGEGTWLATFAEVGPYLLAADYSRTLKIYDNHDPSDPRLVTTFSVPSPATSITRVGTFAYVAEGFGGVQVLDATDPTHLLALGSFPAPEYVNSCFVIAGSVYVPLQRGFAILPSAPRVQFTLQAEGTPGLPLTLEATSELGSAAGWTALLTTAAPKGPFWFTDREVAAGPRFYRLRQP
jgi:hypothetical protein